MGLLFYMKNRFRRYIFPENELLCSLESIMMKQPMSILDVGCGSGWFLAKVLKIAPPASHGVGIEVDSRYFSTVELPDGKRMTIQNDENLTCEQFDLIMFNDVLHHIEGKKNFLLHFLNRLLPSGTVLIKDMCADHALCKYWNRLHDRILSGDEIKETSIEEVQQILSTDYEPICCNRKRILLYDHFWCIYKKLTHD